MRWLVLLALLALPAAAQAPEAPSGRGAATLVTGRNQMIVTAHPLATAAGRDALRRGGSAVDAAIAALMVLGVVEPQSSGLGGGGFALVQSDEGLTSYDAREAAPASASPDMFTEWGLPMPFLTAVASGRSVGVPGLPRLLETLHRRHGRLSWATLFGPAIRLAEDGFAISPRLAASSAAFRARLASGEAGAVFLGPEGAPLVAGATLRQPALAATLRAVAARGADAVMTGPVAEAIVASVARDPRPGGLSLADLAAYRVIERRPVCFAYRAVWRICSMGPPSSGATTLGQMLGLHARALPPGADDTTDWHIRAEASRLAYADRARYLADPDQVAVPVAGLLDPGYLDTRAALIAPAAASQGRAEPGVPPGAASGAADPAPGAPGTTHLNVVDAKGLAVSLTASIETAFGSGRMAAGLLLNNQLTDFAFSPRNASGRAVVNAAAPGKRPRSSMAPTIVYAASDPGLPVALLGSPGGGQIPEYLFDALIGLLDQGMDPAQAVAAPHFSQRNSGTLTLEQDQHPAERARALAAMGHAVAAEPMTSGLAILQRTATGWRGAADPRREGTAWGD